MTLEEMLDLCLRSLEKMTVTAVLSIKQHIFQVDVKSMPSIQIKNFPKQQKISGTVVVGNQKNLERELKEIRRLLTHIAQLLEKGNHAK